MRFSTDALPARDRLAVWSEVFGHHIAKTQFEPVDPLHYSQTATLRSVAGLSLISGSSVAFRATRNRRLVADGNDDLALIVNTMGKSGFRQLGRETEIGANDAVLMSNGEEGSCVYPDATRYVVIGVPRNVISGLMKNAESALCRRLPSSDTLHLLLSYIRSVDQLALDTPGLSRVVTTHIQDLMALAIGATGDGAELARGRSLRAARLAAIKLDVRKLFGRADLSVVTVALRHGVTPRYVQKLFESEGTTFTEYVVERRLAEARRMLGDPRFSDHAIGDIALRCGYGDMPHFSRSFRRRFGMTPTDARAHRERS
ncbi:AraC family transcriptional regulator [Bradyrhizobium sp. Cp5.3]|uniref:AraC family transcriptional regulator n=1 Tax=Bradyrhizobium sp. Cp5.3 TaxID=443598 RepID=UPI0018DBD78E|nr:AraC family transcriptional regulator [Bradyrhizobium sp. Cp5.3]